MSNKKKMYLWVWEGVLTDYSSGIMFAVAPSAEEARLVIAAEEAGTNKEELENYKLYRKRAGSYPGFVGTTWKDLNQTPDKYPLDKPVAFLIWGGG